MASRVALIGSACTSAQCGWQHLAVTRWNATKARLCIPFEHLVVLGDAQVVQAAIRRAARALGHGLHELREALQRRPVDGSGVLLQLLRRQMLYELKDELDRQHLHEREQPERPPADERRRPLRDQRERILLRRCLERSRALLVSCLEALPVRDLLHHRPRGLRLRRSFPAARLRRALRGEVGHVGLRLGLAVGRVVVSFQAPPAAAVEGRELLVQRGCCLCLLLQSLALLLLCPSLHAPPSGRNNL
eukprot:359393-Prymnesium_polylepis.1